MNRRNSDQDEWLAQAAQALADAERLTGLLAQAWPHQDLAMASLQAEIMGLRQEVERLRRERSSDRPRDFDPAWLESAWTAAC